LLLYNGAFASADDRYTREEACRSLTRALRMCER